MLNNYPSLYQSRLYSLYLTSLLSSPVFNLASIHSLYFLSPIFMLLHHLRLPSTPASTLEPPFDVNSIVVPARRFLHSLVGYPSFDLDFPSQILATKC